MAKAAAKTSASKNAASTTKKPARRTEAKPIKYADKSAGQPELIPIFNTLVKLMEPFAKGSMKKSGGKEGQFGLTSKKTVEIAPGKKMEEVWFSGLLIQKGYVGFYFMPVYDTPELKGELHPELLKCLKGKSCFHIKKMDETVAAHVKEALQKGYNLYKKKGWIS